MNKKRKIQQISLEKNQKILAQNKKNLRSDKTGKGKKNKSFLDLVLKKEAKRFTVEDTILALVVAGALGGGYYFKVIKKKEKEELENLKEEDDFFSEAEEYEESEASETEDI